MYGWRCATPISPPPSASRPRSTIFSASRPPNRSIPPPSSCRSPGIQGQGGNPPVTISEDPQGRQPNPEAPGTTTVTPNSRVGVTEDGKKFALVKDGVSL